MTFNRVLSDVNQIERITAVVEETEDMSAHLQYTHNFLLPVRYQIIINQTYHTSRLTIAKDITFC
jgi:hypothetical protein